MNITETNIPDISRENLTSAKTMLADQIITHIYPLFDEIQLSKTQHYEELRKEYFAKKQKVKESKVALEESMKEYQRKKKLSVLLSRIDKLVSAGLTYDSSLKHEITILLKIAHRLSEEKLNERINETMNMLRKRFAK
jgi:hypothetical protein